MGVLQTLGGSQSQQTTARLAVPWWTRPARVSAAVMGIVGVLIAVNALLVFFFVLANAVISGELNPYAGVLLFVIVPVMAAIGAVMAWGAYQVWRTVAR